jgi:hypothetical protein
MKWMNLKCFFLVIFLTNCFYVHAKPEWYQHYDYLNGGFNLDDFNQCRFLVKRCVVPKGHLFPDQTCIDKVLESNQCCQQAKKLLVTIDFYYNGLSAEKYENYTLINATSVADGQSDYYIVTQSGYLVNTMIDPVSFNPELSKNSKVKTDIIVNFNKPIQKITKDHDIFTAILSARECVACQTNLCAKVDFVFSKSGDPLDLQIRENSKMCKR